MRPAQPTNILGNTDARHVILKREDTLEELNNKFPGLVKKKVLFTLTSKFYQTLLEVYIIKVDVDLVRIGIQVDGVEKGWPRMVTDFNG